MEDAIFRVSTRDDGERVIVALSGELDLAGVGELEQAIHAARASGRPLTLDLTALEFIDSSGLRVFLALHNDATRHAFEYRVIPGPPQVHRAFALCGLDETLSFAA